MQRIFGRPKPKEAPAPPPDLAAYTDRLNKQLPELDKKIEGCDRELAALKVQISKARPGPQQSALKQKALAVLKRRKIYEGQRGGVQARAFNLEQTQFAVDTVKDATEHMTALKFAGGQLRTAQATVDIDALEDLQDDMADMLADTAEISEVLGREYDVGEGVNEADLDAELDALGDLGDASGYAEAGAVDAGAEADAAAWGGVEAPAAPSAPSAASYYPAVPTAAPVAPVAPRPVATGARF